MNLSMCHVLAKFAVWYMV